MQPPRYLYRYRPVNDFTLQEIAVNSVYLCPLDKLNDEEEGYFTVEPSDLRQFRDRLIELALADHKQQFAVLLRALDDNDLRKLHTQALQLGGEYLDTRGTWGVACFTERFDNAQMWARYAAEGRGLVIEYDLSSVTIPEGALLKVTYGNERGCVQVSNVLDPAQAGKFSKELAVKGSEWAVEEEWRLLVNQVGPVILNFSIARVITGLQATNEDSRSQRFACSSSGAVRGDVSNIKRRNRHSPRVLTYLTTERKTI
jgi:hypothetical protein